MAEDSRMPARPVHRCRPPWNKGLLVGQKKPLEPKHVWSIRVRLEIALSMRDLAIFNLAIDSKLRAWDLVKLRLDDICSAGAIARPKADSPSHAFGAGPCPFKCLLKRRSLSARPRGLACSLKRCYGASGETAVK